MRAEKSRVKMPDLLSRNGFYQCLQWNPVIPLSTSVSSAVSSCNSVDPRFGPPRPELHMPDLSHAVVNTSSLRLLYTQLQCLHPIEA